MLNITTSPHRPSESQPSDVVYASIALPDPDRSPTGAWTLPHNLEARIQEFRSPSRTEAQCWELAGAAWEEDWYTRHVHDDDEKVTLWVQDPAKTTIQIAEDGVTFSGAWKMKRARLYEALRLKQSNLQWTWSQCFEEVGAEWDIWCMSSLSNL
jgi:hypothetical protein